MTDQHYRITLETAISDYACGILTAKGAIASWIRVHLAPGWKRSIVPKKIREMFRRGDKAMPRSTFWKAMHSLQADGFVDFDEPTRLTVTRPKNEPKPPSARGDDGPEKETTAQKSGQPSTQMDERPPDPPPPADRSEGPDFYQIYSDFLKEREKGEAEEFDLFVKRQAAELPQPPVLVECWAGKNLRELWKKFTRERQPIARGQNSAPPSTEKNQKSDDSLDRLPPIVRQALEAGAISYRPNRGQWAIDYGNTAYTIEGFIAVWERDNAPPEASDSPKDSSPPPAPTKPPSSSQAAAPAAPPSPPAAGPSPGSSSPVWPPEILRQIGALRQKFSLEGT